VRERENEEKERSSRVISPAEHQHHHHARGLRPEETAEDEGMGRKEERRERKRERERERESDARKIRLGPRYDLWYFITLSSPRKRIEGGCGKRLSFAPQGILEREREKERERGRDEKEERGIFLTIHDFNDFPPRRRQGSTSVSSLSFASYPPS